MLCLIKRVIFGALIIAIMPIAVLLSGWTWQPNGDTNFLHLFYYITETASYPWAGITCIILGLWFVVMLKPSRKNSLWLLIVLAGAVLCGQFVKSIVKESVAEPRPYVMWLENEYKVDDEFFYHLPREQRAEIIVAELQNDFRVPVWLKTHWQNETGYAFPSGHALFTTTWALLGIALLWPRKRYITAILLVTWSIIVSGSRLVLGMHWPQDLILATIFSGIIAILVGWVCLRYRLMLKDNVS